MSRASAADGAPTGTGDAVPAEAGYRMWAEGGWEVLEVSQTRALQLYGTAQLMGGDIISGVPGEGFVFSRWTGGRPLLIAVYPIGGPFVVPPAGRVAVHEDGPCPDCPCGCPVPGAREWHIHRRLGAAEALRVDLRAGR